MTVTHGRRVRERTGQGAGWPEFDQARLVAVNELRAVVLLDVAAESQDVPEDSDFYVSGSRSEVSALCGERSPDVWRVIADSVPHAAPDRIVVRIRVGHSAPGRSHRERVGAVPPRSPARAHGGHPTDNGLFGSLYEPSDRCRIEPGGLINDMTMIGDLRQLWGSCPVDYDGLTVLVRSECAECGRLLARRVCPESLPDALRCAACDRPSDASPAPAGLPALTLDGLRVLVDTGLFDVLHGGSRGATVGMYDSRWRAVLVGENTRDEGKTITFPPETPLPRSCPQRLGFVARNDALYDIASTAISVPRTPAMLAFTEVCYGYMWCMFDSGITCEQCVTGLSAQSMYATFAEYYHFKSDVNDSLGELSRATAEYIQHCLAEHPNSALCQVMDNWQLATQAVYLDVLHPKATEPRFDGDELRALRYRTINSGARTIALLNLLEGAHSGVVTGKHVEAVTMMMFSVHDALDRRCDIRGQEANNLFNIVAAHNGTESADLLGRFCTDVLAWAVDKQSMWPILAAGRLLLWQIHCYRYRSVEILDNLSIGDHPLRDPYRDQVLNSFNPLLSEGNTGAAVSCEQSIAFSVRARCSNHAWYDRQVSKCLDHFAVCGTSDGYDRASWSDRAAQAKDAYVRKQAGDCGCVDALAVYNSLVLLENIWWAASSAAVYTGPTGEWDPLLV